MGENRTEDHSEKERIINFALLIRKTLLPNKIVNYEIHSENQGIPDPEVILIVDEWLQQVRLKWRKNMGFDKSPSP